MKEQFHSISAIFSYYYFLKLNVESTPSCFPSQEQLKDYVQVSKPLNAQSLREARYCFIGDVENFLDNRLEWWEKLILTSRIVPDGSYPRSWNEIRNDLMAEQDKRLRENKLSYYPRQLRLWSNVRREFFRIHYRAKDYFKGRGYIE